MVDVKVRPMEKEDKEIVSKFIYESFWQKMLPLHSLSESEARQLIKGLMFSLDESLAFYYMAEVDGKVVGMIKLKTADDKEDYIFNQIYTLLKVGVIKLIQAGILLQAMDYKVPKEHMFIEMIAVDSDYRGLGIGTKLLSFGENKARATQGITKYSLQVIEKNRKAKILYERFGFKAVRSQWNSVVKGLGGIRKVYIMEKKL